VTFSTSLATARDRARFYAGDTDTTDEQAADATYDALLAIETNERLVARAVCLSRAAYWGRFSDTKNGALDESGNAARAKGFQDRAEALLAESIRLNGRTATVRMGGVTQSQDDRMDRNSDAKAPSFTLGMFNNRRP
jgi:hypothetical protein